MTLEEAEKILAVDTKTHKIERVSESNNYFIFNVVPASSKRLLDRTITPSVAIEKSTGRKLAFNPMRFPKDELKSIKRIR